MIGIDTNVLVHYIAQDDAVQSAQASDLIEQECSQEIPGFVGIVVLLQLVWVSESCYGATRTEIAEIVWRILSTRHLVVEEAELVWKALRLFESGEADFSDCVIERVADAAGCTRTLTFDRQAAATAGMTLVGGVRPAKVRPVYIQKLPDVGHRFAELAAADGFTRFPVDHRHGLRAGSRRVAHRDPVGRVLAAQSELESVHHVIRDPPFAHFGTRAFW